MIVLQLPLHEESERETICLEGDSTLVVISEAARGEKSLPGKQSKMRNSFTVPSLRCLLLLLLADAAADATSRDYHLATAKQMWELLKTSMETICNLI